MEKCKHCKMNEKGKGKRIDGYIPRFGDTSDGADEWAVISRYSDVGFVLEACKQDVTNSTSAYIPINNCPMCGEPLG